MIFILNQEVTCAKRKDHLLLYLIVKIKKEKKNLCDFI